MSQNFYYDPYQMDQPARSSGKKGNGLKIAAVILSCLLFTALVMTVFIALVNSGVIDLGNGPQLSNTNIVVQKVVDVTEADENTGSIQKLSTQEICAAVIPSVCCVLSYNSTGGSVGSGVIWSEDGYIVTNAHVVEDAQSLKAVFYDSQVVSATLVGSDPYTDLAVIKVDTADLTAGEDGEKLVPIAIPETESLQLSIGDPVVAIGNPGGLAYSSSASFGYISGLNRSIETEEGYSVQCIQTDAAINPGNSGGALVNEFAQLIGINSSKIADTDFEGMGFAIDIEVAYPIINELIQTGKISGRLSLGFTYSMLSSIAGVQITEITNPLLLSGSKPIAAGDIVTQINGKNITSASVITEVLTDPAYQVGDTVTIQVKRLVRSNFFFGYSLETVYDTYAIELVEG